MKGDIQDVAAELKLQFASSAFLTVLAAVDAEKGLTDTAVTPGPATVNDFEAMDVSGLGYPVLEIIGRRTTYDETDEVAKDATHELELNWTVVGDDEKTITRQVQNLARATVDFLWPETGPRGLATLGSAPVLFVSEDYSDLMPATAHPFVKGSTTRIQVKTLRT